VTPTLIIWARFLGGAVVASYGLAKMLGLPGSARSMWWPRWTPSQTVVPMVATIAAAECIVGVSVALGVARAPTTPAICILGTIVTIYGIGATREGAPCGCAGTRLEGLSQPSTLVARNTSLFGVLLLANNLGPSSLAAATAHDATAVAMLAAAPALLLSLTVLVRLCSSLAARSLVATGDTQLRGHTQAAGTADRS